MKALSLAALISACGMNAASENVTTAEAKAAAAQRIVHEQPKAGRSHPVVPSTHVATNPTCPVNTAAAASAVEKGHEQGARTSSVATPAAPVGNRWFGFLRGAPKSAKPATPAAPTVTASPEVAAKKAALQAQYKAEASANPTAAAVAASTPSAQAQVAETKRAAAANAPTPATPVASKRYSMNLPGRLYDWARTPKAAVAASAVAPVAATATATRAQQILEMSKTVVRNPMTVEDFTSAVKRENPFVRRALHVAQGKELTLGKSVGGMTAGWAKYAVRNATGRNVLLTVGAISALYLTRELYRGYKSWKNASTEASKAPATK
jgi:hypothetical protein